MIISFVGFTFTFQFFSSRYTLQGCSFDNKQINVFRGPYEEPLCWVTRGLASAKVLSCTSLTSMFMGYTNLLTCSVATTIIMCAAHQHLLLLISLIELEMV